MEDYYNFLMYELKDIEEEGFENASSIAHEVCILFSLDKQPMPETFYRLYLANLNTDYSVFYNATAYFAGAGLLQIQCDCSDDAKYLCDLNSIDQSAFYDKAIQDRKDNSSVYVGTVNSVEKMREIIQNDC